MTYKVSSETLSLYSLTDSFLMGYYQMQLNQGIVALIFSWAVFVAGNYLCYFVVFLSMIYFYTATKYGLI